MVVPTIPAVSTTDVTNVTQTSVTLGGNVSSEGDALVQERGICWSMTSNPTVSDNKISNGVGLGSFTGTISGLTAGTTYHARAYAKNSVGVAYGTDVQFTTNSIQLDVTTFSGANGKATAQNKVDLGGKFDVTAVPNLGYMTDSITVNGVKFNLNGTNTYTVMNNLKPPVITVTFKMDVMWTLLEKPWVEVLYQERNHLKSGAWTDYKEGKFHVEKYVFHNNGMMTPYLDGNQGADRKYELRTDSLIVGIYPNGLYGNKYKIVIVNSNTYV